MNADSNPHPVDPPASNDRFRVALESLAALMSAEGCVALAASAPELPYFQRLDDAGQALALRRVETMNAVCVNTLQRGHRIFDNAALTMSFLSHAGLTSVDSLFETLHEDDGVEIFNTDHLSEFISANTLRVVSYSLEELYCRQWTELLARDVRGVHDALLQLSLEMLDGKHQGLVPTNYIPDHVCREVDSSEMRSIIMFPHFFAPIYRDGKVAGYLCANKLFEYNELPPFGL
jgi:hypothetical protein